MSGIFAGLESLGLGDLSSKIEVYETGSVKKEDGEETKVQQVQESDYIFDKTFTCPCCDKEFKSKTVKTGKVKLISADTDLRPKYQMVDSLKYDAIVCPNCGYAALNRFFSYVTSMQVKLIKENITKTFRGLSQEGDILSYDEAIMRHKLVLVNTIVKKAKLSERAYTCLKTAWLLRGKAETLPMDTVDRDGAIKLLSNEENEFLVNAYDGFLEAFSKELFPMCGMDENTTTYLVADLARRIGKYEEASRWVSRVLIARDANDRIKSKARDIKDLVQAELKKQKEQNS